MRIYFFLAALLGTTLISPPSRALGEVLWFRLLPQESKILTEISDPFGQTVKGEFTLKEGEARGQTENLRGSGWVKLTIDAASYNSNLGLRDQDVQESYLHVKDYPLITFTSTNIEQVKEPKSVKESWELTISGVLELHGVKRELQLPARVTYQGKKITAEGTTKIALKDFNIDVPTLVFMFRSGDQVQVNFRIVGEQKP